MKEKKKMLLPLNIQLFADEGGAGSDDPTPKTYTEEEYKKIQDDLAKMKASFDKASSDLAEEKKKNKAKLSEEEKKKADDEEKQRQFEEMSTKLKKFELKASLSKSFDETEIDDIVESIISNDTNKLCELIVKSKENYQKKVTEEAKKQFSKSAKVPGGNGNADDDEDEKTKLIADLAKNQSKEKGEMQNEKNT